MIKSYTRLSYYVVLFRIILPWSTILCHLTVMSPLHFDLGVISSNYNFYLCGLHKHIIGPLHFWPCLLIWQLTFIHKQCSFELIYLLVILKVHQLWWKLICHYLEPRPLSLTQPLLHIASLYGNLNCSTLHILQEH